MIWRCLLADEKKPVSLECQRARDWRFKIQKKKKKRLIVRWLGRGGPELRQGISLRQWRITSPPARCKPLCRYGAGKQRKFPFTDAYFFCKAESKSICWKLGKIINFLGCLEVLNLYFYGTYVIPLGPPQELLVIKVF